ncbi:MAG: hypothetical protein Q8M16_00090 [Pirellulaceae bacterium]|nr:hypothetical protein [Pirellulaceae bacterium]
MDTPEPIAPEERADSIQNGVTQRFNSRPERCSTTEFLCLLVTQLLCVVTLLAPPDGGQWLRYTLEVVLGLDVVAYVAFNFGELRRYSRFSRMAMALFVIAVFSGFIVSMAIELHRLP